MKKLLAPLFLILTTFSDVACQDYICVFPEESLNGIYGRLWANPNPIRFPTIELEDGQFMQGLVILSNIGSDSVTIESIEYSGDDEFHFDDKQLVEQLFPYSLDGNVECDKVSALIGSITYCPRTGVNASGTMIIHTNDPRSWGLLVPLCWRG